MDAKKVINQIFLERGKNMEWLAKENNMQVQSMRTKISRGNYSLTDFIEWMDQLDCDVCIRTRDTKKIFD